MGLKKPGGKKPPKAASGLHGGKEPGSKKPGARKPGSKKPGLKNRLCIIGLLVNGKDLNT